MKLSAYLEELRSHAWAMEPKRLQTLAAAAESAASLEGENLRPLLAITRASARDRDDEEDDDLYDLDDDGLAHVAIAGVLVRKKPAWFSWYGVDSTETPAIKKAIAAAAADPRCEAIVLRVDSPGGQADGVDDVAEAIATAAKEKPVYCVVESLCASGAYWLASRATEISAPKDAEIGSIGVYSVMVDSSALHEKNGIKVHVVRSGDHKGAGIPGAQITEKHLAAELELVDGFASLFKKSVAKGRKGSLDDVDAVATGQTWLAGAAKSKGLIDAVEPVDRALSRLAPGDDDMRDDKNSKTKDDAVETARAEERSRVAAIKKEFAGDPAFALEQIEAEATLGEAKAAYADVLKDRLAKSEAEKTELKTQLGKAQTTKPAPVAPAAGEPVPFAGSADGQDGPVNFVALARAKAKEEGISFEKAASRLSREDPLGHDSWVESLPQKKLSHKGSFTRIGKPQR